jgi:hypothetical protein
MQALRAKIFIKMKSNLAVGPATQAMSRVLQLPLNGFVAIKFSVHDDVNSAVLAAHGLVPSLEVDDAKPGMAQTNSPVGCDPVTLAVGTTMVKTVCGSLQRLR